MNYIPYDVELIIYKNLHELYMIEVCKEMIKIEKNDIIFLTYFQEKALYPYILWNRMIKYNYNSYYKKVIDKYIHRKRMFRVLNCIRVI
jgi:hypothetical protein